MESMEGTKNTEKPREAQTLRTLTPPMQDYLRLIHELGQDGVEVTGSRLIERNGFRHASVSNMLKKLEKMGLVWREPYYEVGLTNEGQRAALGVVRRHRLIELYLFKALDYPWDEVHEEAERMEHAASEQLVDRLERLLGYPKADAHGAYIPGRDGEVYGDSSYVSLAGLDGGERATIRRVLDREPEVLRHLAGLGLILGVELSVLERHPFEGPLIVDAGEGSLIVSRELARHVFVEPTPAEAVEAEPS